MNTTRKLLAVLAHPDDESLGFGGTLARCAAEGVETYLVTATRGERGRYGKLGKTVDPEVVGPAREAELRAAARVLGIREVCVLGFPDGGLDGVDERIAISHIVAQIRRVRPDVVVTFGPEGAYGHPDHIAISQYTTAACVCAGDAWYEPGARAHRVSKLYYLAWTRDQWDAYQEAFKKLVSTVDGVERQATPWPDWAITTEMDTAEYWPVAWKAIQCHETQMAMYERLEQLTEEHHRALWGSQKFYRAYSTVNGGKGIEANIFDGLR